MSYRRWVSSSLVLFFLIGGRGVPSPDAILTDPGWFFPSQVTISAGESNGERVIVQAFRWDDVSVFASDSVLMLAVVLNNGGEKYAQGVWLDDAATLGVPNFMPVVDFEGSAWSRQARFGDPDFYRRYGVTILDPTKIVAGKTYFVTWRTPPGTVSIDNANWEISYGIKIAGCSLGLCIYERARCRVNEDEYGIDPIKAGATYSFTAYGSCLDMNTVHIPLVDR